LQSLFSLVLSLPAHRFRSDRSPLSYPCPPWRTGCDISGGLILPCSVDLEVEARANGASIFRKRGGSHRQGRCGHLLVKVAFAGGAAKAKLVQLDTGSGRPAKRGRRTRQFRPGRAAHHERLDHRAACRGTRDAHRLCVIAVGFLRSGKDVIGTGKAGNSGLSCRLCLLENSLLLCFASLRTRKVENVGRKLIKQVLRPPRLTQDDNSEFHRPRPAPQSPGTPNSSGSSDTPALADMPNLSCSTHRLTICIRI